MHHSKMLIFVIFGVSFVENFIQVCFDISLTRVTERYQEAHAPFLAAGFRQLADRAYRSRSVPPSPVRIPSR